MKLYSTSILLFPPPMFSRSGRCFQTRVCGSLSCLALPRDLYGEWQSIWGNLFISPFFSLCSFICPLPWNQLFALAYPVLTSLLKRNHQLLKLRSQQTEEVLTLLCYIWQVHQAVTALSHSDACWRYYWLDCCNIYCTLLSLKRYQTNYFKRSFCFLNRSNTESNLQGECIT